MKSGKLTETIRIERATGALNEYGTPEAAWTRLATIRAERIDATTEEFMRGFGASDEQAVVFRVRFIEGVSNADRVIWQGEAFNIQQVTPIGRRKGLDLRCVRVAA